MILGHIIIISWYANFCSFFEVVLELAGLVDSMNGVNMAGVAANNCTGTGAFSKSLDSQLSMVSCLLTVVLLIMGGASQFGILL